MNESSTNTQSRFNWIMCWFSEKMYFSRYQIDALHTEIEIKPAPQKKWDTTSRTHEWSIITPFMLFLKPLASAAGERISILFPLFRSLCHIFSTHFYWNLLQEKNEKGTEYESISKIRNKQQQKKSSEEVREPSRIDKDIYETRFHAQPALFCA